jgi:hypothetical protein
MFPRAREGVILELVEVGALVVSPVGGGKLGFANSDSN